MKNMEHEHIIELPERGYFKVVQISVEDMPYLAFDNLGGYHRNILRKFLENNKIEFESENAFGKELPRTTGKNYKVVGMGYFYKSGKELVFSGNSADYHIGINAEHIEKCKQYFNNNELEVIIG